MSINFNLRFLSIPLSCITYLNSSIYRTWCKCKTFYWRPLNILYRIIMKSIWLRISKKIRSKFIFRSICIYFRITRSCT